MQWRTRHPLPDRMVGRLRWARRAFVAFFLLEAVSFALTLTEEQPSAWTLTWTGIGTVYFPLLFLMTHRLLRKDSRARASRASRED
ncbi:hypothetical protein GKJPGBOP_07295 [Streptomyces paromomycinus]|uniref:Uncharacterized protein n=1 Tax=Streptomyces paromomycinus TaxID=92743 RepID=A0A401WDW6_STREY|nr:hypothetical protein GKJPGBOP_07295 [Streptomyces paromomycinus]